MNDVTERQIQPAMTPSPKAAELPCPYCGALQPAASPECASCGGVFEPLSRQASQNAMGPWWVRDEQAPHHPGCSYDTLRKLVQRKKVSRESIIRGPTTRQFWMLAQDVPGVSHLLGLCYACHNEAGSQEYMCRSCGAVFEASVDRQRLGLAPMRLLPGDASPEQVAESTLATSSGAWAVIDEPPASSAAFEESKVESGVTRATAGVQAVQNAVNKSAHRAQEESTRAAQDALAEFQTLTRSLRLRSLWLSWGLAVAVMTSTGLAIALLVVLLRNT